MDREIILKRLEFISTKLEDLSYDLKKIETTKEKRDKTTLYGAIERWCEEIVESAISINQELLSLKHKSAQSYYLSFIMLEEFELFDEKTLLKLASTAGFRNRLAHDYMDLDKEIMVVSAKALLNLYVNYVKTISSYVN